MKLEKIKNKIPEKLYSILVNGLVLWTVPILMTLGGIGALLGLIFAPLGQLLIYISYPLLLYFESIVNFFGRVGGVLWFRGGLRFFCYPRRFQQNCYGWSAHRQLLK